MRLDDYRAEIDTIDKQITKLLEQRMQTVRNIGICKQTMGKPVLDASRENSKLEALKAQTDEDSYSYIAEIFKEIMAQSRRFQEEHKADYGLLGRTLGHSFSPRIHKSLGGYSYELFEVEPENLKGFFENTALKGFNVTIPYKKDVIKYCSSLSDAAQKTGSVNTIVRNPDGSFAGHNTDYYGLDYLIRSAGFEVSGAKIIILGNGGVSGTVRQLMNDRGASEVVTISRKGEENYENISRHYDAEFVINTTPVGMYPDNGRAVIDITEFKSCRGVIDLIYNPIKTRLVMDAENMGIPAEGGLKMLVAQAAGACELFLGSKISDELIEAEYMRILRQVENIILIGMPGCGKSSIGERLAEITGKSFADSDIKIIEQTGRNAEDIICSDGEEYFRRVETAVAKAEGAHTGCVIATGGGVVTREENLDLLRQNGRIVYIKRSLEKLSSDGRPISAANKIEDLFSKRKAAYESWSDFEVDNTGIEETASNIAKMLGYGR
mgnify:FL=1